MCACALLWQRKLKAAEEERKKQKLYEKKVKYSKMSAAKKERFRQIRIWKKTEVARLIQQWWRYLQKQKAYYEAVKLAQVRWGKQMEGRVGSGWCMFWTILSLSRFRNVCVMRRRGCPSCS